MHVVASSERPRPRPLRPRGLPGATPDELVAFTLQLDDLNRQISGAGATVTALLTETQAIKETLLRSRAPQTLRDRARTMELDLLDIQQALEGNETRSLYSEGGPVSIGQRLEVARFGTFRSTYGPTAMHERMVEIALEQFEAVKTRLQQLNQNEMPALRRDLDTSGVPWTPGRGVPAD